MLDGWLHVSVADGGCGFDVEHPRDQGQRLRAFRHEASARTSSAPTLTIESDGDRHHR